MSSLRHVCRNTLLACVLGASLAQAQEPAPAAEAAPAPDAPVVAQQPPTAPFVTVILTDGQQLRGRLVYRDANEMELELPSGGRMRLASNSVQSLHEDLRPGQPTPPAQPAETAEATPRKIDPNRTRYLYAPSAHMLRQGEGYFSAKELAFYSVGYGVTDNFTLLVGSLPYIWLLPNGQGLNVIAAAKLGVDINETLHMAGGAEVLALPAFGGAGFVFGAATLGGTESHLTLALGRPFAFNAASQSLVGDMIVTVNGTLRVAPGLALVSENWIFPNFSGGTASILNGLAVRIFFDRLALDLGLVGVNPGGTGYFPVPIPWLDITYNFG